MPQQLYYMKHQDNEINKTIEEILEDQEYRDIVSMKANLYFMLGGEKEDLIQEGMIGLVKAYNNFDPSRGASFKTFANQVVQHEICNAVIRANRKKYSPLNEAGEINEELSGEKSPSPEELVIFNDFWDTIMSNKDNMFGELEFEVLKQLSQGKKYKEIAAELGKTPKQIDNAMQRIKQKIKSL